MATMAFINLPVDDLARAKEFFVALGYRINEQFTDENAAAVVISDEIVVMLLLKPFFATFTPTPIADGVTEVLVGISAVSREAVDTLVDTALIAGATEYSEPRDYGTMYQRAFRDLDGHHWEIIWMDDGTVG